MEEALYSFLLGDAGVTAITGDRLSCGWRQQGSAVPAATILRTDGADDPIMRGVSGFIDGYAQVDCWGGSYGEAKTLARAIRSALHGVRRATTAGVIQAAFVEHEADSFEGEAPERLFRTRLDLRVPHSET